MHNFKKILYTLIIFIAIFGSYLNSQEYWRRIASPTTKWLTKCSLVDTVFGWAAGDSGVIIHTSTSGNSWVLQNTGITSFPISDICFINKRLGWAVANDFLFTGTVILKTTNGGANWTSSRFPDTSIVFNTISFLDSLTGFMGGVFPGVIYKTPSAGSSWFSCTVDTSYCPMLYLFPKHSMSFLNSMTGFASGGHIDIQGMIWRTTDGGLNWLTYCVAPEPMEAIQSVSGNRIVSTGGDFEFGASFVQSYDGGNTWLYDSITGFGVGHDIAFRTPSELWIPLAFARRFCVNLDSGGYHTRWYVIDSPDSTSPYAAQFVTPTFGLAFGYDGVIMKYNTDIIGIKPEENNVPLKSTLYQNYPNPFNPSTIITYYLAKSEFVKITLFDLLGKQIRVFLEGVKPAGFNKLKFYNFGLASGVYFYNIEAGVFIESKKMMIVK